MIKNTEKTWSNKNENSRDLLQGVKIIQKYEKVKLQIQ